MRREEALINFEKTTENILLKYQEKFQSHLIEQMDLVYAAVEQGLRRLGEKIIASKKESTTYFQFSLLRVSIIDRSYEVLLYAYDSSWYLDEQPVHTSFTLDFAFVPLQELADELLAESKKYVGKVNLYDVQYMIFREAYSGYSKIAQYLRNRLRDLEENAYFVDIPKSKNWIIRWGEYKDQSEILLQRDYNTKNHKDWEAALKKVEESEACMVHSYWYKGDYKGYKCQDKKLHYIGFDKCQLEEIDFEKTVLIGASFKDCEITKCQFKEADLSLVDFTGTSFEEVDFKNAKMAHAIFLESVVPYLHLSPSQLQMIKIVRM